MTQRSPQEHLEEQLHTTADAAQRHLQERGQARTARQRDLLARLQKVQDQIDRWEAWDALSPAQQLEQPALRPNIPHKALLELRQLIVDELDFRWS